MAPRPSEPSDERDSGDAIIHEYDGILEMDNRLPKWWLATLFGAILFGSAYWLYFHSFDLGELPDRKYQREKAAQIAIEAEKLKQAGEVTAPMLITFSKDQGTVDEGKATFDTNCVTCHAEGGKGNIGPNLTDDFWLHGGAPLEIYETVHDGYAPKQMPAWGPKLGEQRVRSVVAYVLSIQGTNVPGGKAPQGERR